MPPLNRVHLAATFFLAFLTSAPARAEGRQPQIPELKVEKYTLQNGLDVLLLEDHTTPVVAVNIWYKVGSKNEKRGRTGFAHLFEHLMFQGSQHHDRDYFASLEKIGAWVNGRTNVDGTKYFESLPSNGLETALWLESDRMGFLLPVLTKHKLEIVRDVVKNERRQRIDDVPYMESMEDMSAALSAPNQPNHHTVIGSMADLSAASLADVSAFFRDYYAPSNASLAITGDFKPLDAKRLVEKYFGPLRAGPKVQKLKPKRQMAELSRYLARTEQVSEARTQLVWPTVERGHADEQALQILAAVLGQLPRGNRLYRTLVVDKQMAVQANASSHHFELSGSFVVRISASPGQTLDDLVRIADGQIELLMEKGPSEDEVVKAQNAYEALLIFSLQSVGRLADFLNANNVAFGDPSAYAGRLRKLFTVTPEDVKRVARKYLTAGRARLDVNPGPLTARAAEAVAERRNSPATLASRRPLPSMAAEKVVVRERREDAGTVAAALATMDTVDRSTMPEIGPNPAFTPPPIVRRKLSNGLEVLIAERHRLPILTLQLICRGGDNVAPPGKEGLAAMTAHLMREGTESRDSAKLAGELSEIGASLGSNGGLESSGLSLSALTRHEAKAIELFADVLLHPSFPQKDLARIRSQRLAALSQRRDTAAGIASVVYPRLLYGSSHPYGRNETISSVKELTRDDAVHFYQKVFLPNNSALIVAGDTTPDMITAKLEEALHGWKPAEPPRWKYSDPPPPQAATIYLVDKPAAAQSVLSVGHVGVSRTTPDYFALLVINGALGGQFASRINLNLREDNGYSYGARSSFSFREGPGPFEASARVQTAVTKEALVELLKEIKDIAGSRPITDEELAFAKDRLIKSFPSRFETTRGQAGTLSELALFRMADDYFTTYQSKIEAVTKEDVVRVARKYIHFEHLTILIVGDCKVIEPKLKETPYTVVVLGLDPEGNPMTKVGSDSAGAGLGRQ
jgi:zinc protease